MLPCFVIQDLGREETVLYLCHLIFGSNLGCRNKKKTIMCYFSIDKLLMKKKKRFKKKKQNTKSTEDPKQESWQSLYLGTGVEKAITAEVCCSLCHWRQTSPLATHLCQKSRIKVSMLLHIQWSRFKHSVAFLHAV